MAFQLFRRKKKATIPQEERPALQRDIPTQNMGTPQIALPQGITLSIAMDIGTRKYQQDYYACSTVRGQFTAIVCDGMGGLEGSEQASKAAATTWIALYEEGFSEFPSFAQRAFVTMDKTVCSCTDAGGTTAAAIWVREGSLHWASVGDSKIYVVRNGTMTTLTREHNYQMVLDARLKRKEISEEEYNKECAKGASLVSYVGRGQMPFTDISAEPLELRQGDIVLVCSDGLYKSVPEERLEKILSAYAGDFDTLASYLVDQGARNTGTRDNTTIVALRYEGDKMSVLDDEM